MRAGRVLGAGGIAFLLAGCAGKLPPPLPTPAEIDVGETVVYAEDGPRFIDLEPLLHARPVDAPQDGILDTDWSSNAEFLAEVEYWMHRMRIRTALDFPHALERLSHHAPIVDPRLEARSLPGSLRYLPVIESGYRFEATSRVGAAGLWQIMAPTARSLGLEVSTFVDERRDPVAATDAALDYLSGLQEKFGSWLLVLAAYNAGPYRVESILQRHAPDASWDDDHTFWRIRPHLPRETRDFVPKFLAAARIGEDPGVHGFEVEPMEPREFETIELEDGASLDVLAEVSGVEEETISFLNPHLIRGMTPPGTTTRLHLPPGASERFAVNWAELPPERRVSFIEHRIASGETLAAIARNYRVPLAEVQGANPSLDPRRLRIGSAVIIPRPGSASARVASAEGGRSVVTAAPPADRVHVVRRGDTLWAIARQYGVPSDRLAAENGLSARATIRPGDRIRVPAMPPGY